MSDRMFYTIFWGIFIAIILLCSSGNSQEECDKLFEFMKSEKTQQVMGSTPKLEGAFECTKIGTNIVPVSDTVVFVLFVRQSEDAEPIHFGTVAVLPGGEREIDAKLNFVIDEHLVVCVSPNAPIGTKFWVCLKTVVEKHQEALIHKP